MTGSSPSRHRWIGGLLVVAIAAGAVWYVRADKRPAGAPTPTAPAASAAAAVPVTIATVATGDFPVTVDGLGSVQPQNTVEIRSRVDGQIVDIHFSEGQMVAKGDLLVRIDARPFKAALDQAIAKRAQDTATLDNAKLDLTRIAQLAERSYASRQQLDAQQATVAAAQALVQADDAAIENAQVQLGYTEIRAPIGGRIGFRQVDAGNIVHAADQTSILSIVQTDPITVVFTVPEGHAGEIRRAMTKAPLAVDVLSTDRRATAATGRLAVINNQVDAQTGTIQLKAEFPNAELELWPGQSVTARLRLADLPGVAIVPSTAVQRGQAGLYAWVVDDGGSARVRKVTVGREAGGRSAVTEGLAAGEHVVTFGQYRLRDGARVDARPAAEETAQKTEVRS